MNIELQPLVSVVTPIYNGADHLAECIESVLAQTYRNWDYTIIDNCSSDGSVDIARRYAESDRRIRVIENREFLQAIPNHNAALRQISRSSKYCKVVFADDWIFPECLEKLVAVAEQYPSVGIVGAYVLEGQQVICTGLPYTSKVVSGREICRRHFLDDLYVFGSANSVLYRADLIRNHNPFYNEENIHSDTEVCFRILTTCDFGFVHQVLTFTRVRPGSLTTVSTDMQTDLAGMLRSLETHGPDYLSREELEDRLGRHLSEYYRFLGKSLIQRRGKTWNYHKKKLIESGGGFSWARVAGGVLATLWGLALHPKGISGKLRKAGASSSSKDSKQNLESEPGVIRVKEAR